MLIDYIVLLILVIFSIGFPVSVVLGSILLGRREVRNEVKNLPFESGEEPFDLTSKDINLEYLPYFVMFIVFEIIAAILIAAAYSKAEIGSSSMLYLLIIALLATILEIFIYKIANERYER
ncbi:MAG: NADH-quinone oxidoreductase subunit A [Candidatus Micrarchaeota archaeon]|nr:MAG: NADH-quinone oxidoreductase subunit A [Candidatus Micrarchaeota archaeon]